MYELTDSIPDIYVNPAALYLPTPKDEIDQKEAEDSRCSTPTGDEFATPRILPRTPPKAEDVTYDYLLNYLFLFVSIDHNGSSFHLLRFQVHN